MNLLGRQWVSPLIKSQVRRGLATKTDSLSDQKKVAKEAAEDVAQEWLASPEGGGRYKGTSSPGFVTNSAAPFPTNPFFIPPRPISDATKVAIYALYKENPSLWTPRKLASHFGISIARTTAILRLKSLQAQMEAQGIAPQVNLTMGMEKMLNPIHLQPESKTLKKTYEPERSDYAESMIPYFRFVNETETFTPEDAALLMQKDPWSNLEKTLNVKAERVFTPGAPTEKGQSASDKVYQDKDQKHSGKFHFMFVDTSKEKRDPDAILLRDTKGTLRRATVLEKWYKKRGSKEKYVLG